MMRRILGMVLRHGLRGQLRKQGWGRGPILLAMVALTVVLSLAFGGGGGRFLGRLGDFGGGGSSSSSSSSARSSQWSDAAAQPAGVGGAGQPKVAPGEFDYYVLALSWSPSYCRTRPDADQCGKGRGFIAHGLWPQFERGWPKDCQTSYDAPTNTLLRRYEDLSGGRGLLKHQWRKHGSCTGLSPGGYFATLSAAMGRVTIPEAYRSLSADRTGSAREVEQAFVRANSGFVADGVTVKCGDGRLREVRVCFTKTLEPRACGADVVRDCRDSSLGVPAPK